MGLRKNVSMPLSNCKQLIEINWVLILHTAGCSERKLRKGGPLRIPYSFTLFAKECQNLSKQLKSQMHIIVVSSCCKSECFLHELLHGVTMATLILDKITVKYKIKQQKI